MSKPCLTIPPPHMLVGKDIHRFRIDHFMNKKYIPLSNTAGRLDTCFLFYKAIDFIAMMKYFFNTLAADGVRIYIADYSAEGHESVPADHGGMLTLIFSPTRDKEKPGDMSFYYSIPPKGSFDTATSQLDKIIANEWVVNYQMKKLLRLNETLKETTGLPHPQTIDTKAIHFTKEQIGELVREIQCQQATGIKAYFCSVDPEREPDSKLPARLMLHFMLTIKVGAEETDFYIEDRDGFLQRPEAGEFDTGNPCPPAYCEFMELPLP